MQTTRKTLLSKIKDPNNRRAWEEFYDQYAGPVQRYARKLGLGAADAADVLQETMVELIRILPDFKYDRKRGQFRNFVLTIAHHRVQTAWRRRKRRREIALDDAGGPALADSMAGDPGNAPDSEAEQKWREEIFQEALNRLAAEPGLNRRTLDIFRACVIGNRPAAEVARQFGVTPNHVYQIKHRLTGRLRTLAKPLLEELGELE